MPNPLISQRRYGADCPQKPTCGILFFRVCLGRILLKLLMTSEIKHYCRRKMGKGDIELDLFKILMEKIFIMYDKKIYQAKVRKAASERGLSSLMNQTKWNKLISAVLKELPFPPIYQMKDILTDKPYPVTFDEDEFGDGDWFEAIYPCFSIEWLRIRPRSLVSCGRLISPEIIDEEKQLINILNKLRIPYRKDEETIWIYGYASDTSNIHIGPR